jgi:hypothetical protein
MKIKTIITAAAAALIVAGCGVGATPPEPTPTQSQVETDAVLVPGAKTRAKIVAKDYIDYAGFSESGLAAQLRYEGFSDEVAAWAAANSGANWNQEAVRAAKMFDSSDGKLTRKVIIKQLQLEGFTQYQAEYGADQAGY